MSERVDPHGTLQVPAFTLPFSTFASAEAKAAFIASLNAPPPPTGADIATLRRNMDEHFYGLLIAKQRARYAVTIEPQTIDGVYTEVFIPRDGVTASNRERVLINLHGGGLFMGARTAGQMESIPIAAVGRIKVISVDYRLGPEDQFPAASEDVAVVYRSLLETHEPTDIGIFGSSAGGLLAGEAIAWFQHVGLPCPGAVGILGGALHLFGSGDSAFVTPQIGGSLPALPADAPPFGGMQPYFGNASPLDPLAVPGVSPSVLEKFPPTLLITGTRSTEMSSTVYSHLQLIKAGAHAELCVWDALDHCFYVNPDLPESRDAYDIITRFFAKHLGRSRGSS